MSLNSSTYIRILSKGLEANLPGIEDGKLRFTTDTGRLFLDSGENRVEISDFVKDKTAQEIIQTEHPLPKFYLASDTNILYYFNNNTDQWNTVKVDIGLATTASEGLMPALEDDTSKFLRSDGTWAEAGNVKLEELEREDYDELSEDEKNNGTLYMVKDKVPDVTDFPALIGEYYKIDNSKLNPNFDWGGIKFFFNSDDCSYCYEKYKNRGYDTNAGMHPYYDHGSSSDTRNVLITQNMPTDTHYVGVYHSIYGLQCTSMIFIPKDIIDNGQAAMFLQFFYTSVECTIQYCHIWNDWTDESKYVLQSATLQPGSHPLDWSEGSSIIDSGNLTLSWFANYPIIGGAYISGGEGLTQEEIDTYLATKEDNYPRYFNVNYFTYDHIFKEYDGTVMLNDIDYTGRIDTSKYALKSELSRYASTADLAGKQDVLTAGSNITFNGSTISANNTTYDLATTSSIGLIPALNGSTAKYLRSDGTWEIPAGGGGGSSVVPNPVGEPTKTLNTIGINNIIYDIPGSGGSGSGGNTRSDTLWSGSETPTAGNPSTVSLPSSILNYDLIVIDAFENVDGEQMQLVLPSKTIQFNEYYSDYYYNTASYVKFTDESHVELTMFASANLTTYTKITGLKFGGLFTEELSDMTWTELTSVAGATSSAIPIPDGTKYLLLTSELGTNMNIVAYESIDTINKAITESGISTWNKGYEYYDIGGNHTNIVMAVSNGEVTIKSGYQTVTARVYALSGGVKPYENKVLAPMIYSTEEREVGVWIDNKPLYQKTYVKNNIVLTDNNWTNGVLGTSGIYITDFKAYFGLENTSNSNFPYSYYRNNSEFFTPIIDTSHEDINVRPNMNAGVNVTTGTITIWYTKNSDVPGSGSYNTFGELMHHYSTEEKVVGTWVDGNTLYEKSYTNFSSLTGQSRTLDFQLSGIDKIWYVSDGCLISNGTFPFPYIHYDAANAVGGFWDLSITGSPKFEFRTGSQSTNAVINVFTIRYTKTTS